MTREKAKWQNGKIKKAKGKIKNETASVVSRALSSKPPPHPRANGVRGVAGGRAKQSGF
jgi:hypothetical protein